MEAIRIERQVDKEQLETMGISAWPVWEKEASEFPWTYDASETCYLLDGEVTVIPEGGEAVQFGAGDLVSFPAGMKCRWHISKAVRKHYSFD